MKEKTSCILCSYEAEFEPINPLDKSFRYDCPNCGTFYVDKAFKECDKSDIPLHLLSGFSLEQSKYGGMTKTAITFDSYKEIFKFPYMPKTKEERFEQLMFYYYREIGNDLKHTVTVNSYPAVCYAIDNQELAELFAEALDKKYLIWADNRNEFVQVTYAGAEFCEAVKEKRLRVKTESQKTEISMLSTIWPMIHPNISNVVKKLMLNKHYESAVTTSVKLLENYIRDIYKGQTGKDMNGVPLMQNIFNPNNPVLRFEDINSQSGKDLQDGYRQIFVGVQLGIRNPYSHDTDRKPTEHEALHIIVMISHLMYMADKAVEYTNSVGCIVGQINGKQ